MGKKQNFCNLLTEAGEQGRQMDGWKQHPRPQMKREKYMILSEGWTLNGLPIHVPFPPQSVLAEYDGPVNNGMSYENTFQIPGSFTKERILLHFGAVDQIAFIQVNGQRVGVHEGGYNAFTLDITEYVDREKENLLEVFVKDDLSREYPYGKQRKKRGGMWYTPVSGIWQTVWLENVPAAYISDVVLKPDLEGIHIKLYTDDCVQARRGQAGEDGCKEESCVPDAGSGVKGFCVAIELHNGEIMERNIEGEEGYISLKDYICTDGSKYEPRLWNIENPYLYSMKITASADEVETYFALRTIEIKEMDGIRRVCLNGNPIFFHGVLDQGYFSDGIYLPAEPEEYERDVLRMKELGFNMLRKHIKVEPESFYYYCDKHGMLVMQDMVNNGGYSFLFDTALPTIGLKRRGDRFPWGKHRKERFRQHCRQTIRQLYNHPCIVAYTIFNEGWGQFDSDAMYDYIKALDDSRLIDSTSGWFWQEKNDFDSEHIYFRTIELTVKERPLFVTECGGYSRAVEGHCYNADKPYGYGTAGDEKELTDMITGMYEKMILPGIIQGVCGCIYTQLSDVEDEVNGLYTYDRRVCKVEKEAMLQLSQKIMSENSRIDKE